MSLYRWFRGGEMLKVSSSTMGPVGGLRRRSSAGARSASKAPNEPPLIASPLIALFIAPPNGIVSGMFPSLPSVGIIDCMAGVVIISGEGITGF